MRVTSCPERGRSSRTWDFCKIRGFWALTMRVADGKNCNRAVRGMQGTGRED